MPNLHRKSGLTYSTMRKVNNVEILKRDSDRQPYRRKENENNETNGQRRFVCIVAYDGTNFQGWQTQTNGRTIQDMIEARLKKVFQQSISIAG
jgi:hypothetical protein